MILCGLILVWGGMFLIGAMDGSRSPAPGEPPRAILTRLVPCLLCGAGGGVATILGTSLGWTWPINLCLVGALIGFLAYVFGCLLGYALWHLGLLLGDRGDDGGNLGGLLRLSRLGLRVVRRRFRHPDSVAHAQFQGFQPGGKLPGRHRLSDSDRD